MQGRHSTQPETNPGTFSARIEENMVERGVSSREEEAPSHFIHLLVRVILGVEAHVPRHQTALPAALEAALGVHDAVAPLRRLDELGVLLLEDLEVALGLPVPDGVGGEDEVHFLEGALVGFRVEGPDDDDGGGVDGAEEVEGLFVEGGEDGGEEEHLDCVSISNVYRVKIGFDVPSTRCQ